MREVQNIFDYDKKGWYGQYFSYAFTEDIYQIVLRLVYKIIDSMFCSEPQKAELLKETLRIFYSFQERARASRPDYRDHLVHQFQVFLIGFKIMSSKWWYEYVIKDRPKNIKKSYAIPWAIVSLFHDIGYPFEELEDIKREYIKTLLLLREDSIPMDKVSQDILFGSINNNNRKIAAKELLESFYDVLNPSLNNLSVTRENKERFYWFFNKLFVEEKIHGVTSALYVHQNILNNMDDYDKPEITSALLFHDKPIWKEALKSGNMIDLRSLRKDIIDRIACDENAQCAGKYLIEKGFKQPSATFGKGDKKIKEKCKKMHNLHLILNLYFNNRSWKSAVTHKPLIWAFVFHRIFPKDSLLSKHKIRWHHKINPREHPMQFLLLLSDTLQERGREMGAETFLSECSPEISFKSSNNKLIITVSEPANCSDRERFKLELLKLYIDLYLLKKILGIFYSVTIRNNRVIIILNQK